MDELTSFADLSVLNDDETVSIKFFRSLRYNYCLVTLINKVINGSILDAGLGSRVASRSQTPSVFFAKPPLSRHLSFGC